MSSLGVCVIDLLSIKRVDSHSRDGLCPSGAEILCVFAYDGPNVSLFRGWEGKTKYRVWCSWPGDPHGTGRRQECHLMLWTESQRQRRSCMRPLSFTSTHFVGSNFAVRCQQIRLWIYPYAHDLVLAVVLNEFSVRICMVWEMGRRMGMCSSGGSARAASGGEASTQNKCL